MKNTLISVLRPILFVALAFRVFGQDDVGWGKIWEDRMSVRMANLDGSFELAQQGKFQEALRQVEAAILSEPGNWRPHFLKSAILVLAGRNDAALAEIDYAINIARHSNVPASLLAQLNQSKARSCVDSGRYADARRALETAMKLQPNDPQVLNDLAWILAAATDDRVRNGKRAVTLATKACRLSAWGNPYVIDTLAAAYAEAGKFGDAVRYQQLAIARLPQAEQKNQLGGMHNRLRLYAAGMRFPG
jgi:Flp pilus assembly protein TadD